MPIQVSERVRRDRRSEFSVRRTAFGFLLVAVLVCGAGLTLRTALESAGRHPVAVGFSAVSVVAGAVALLRRRRNRRMAARAASAALEAAYEVVDTALEDRPVAGPEPVRSPETVDWEGMNPYDFEEAVAALCRRDGCTDAEVVGGAGDLGADVVGTTPDGRRLVVQCKRYTAENKVGSQDLQRFGGTCYAVHEAGAAVVVTTGEFTEPAREYAEQCGIVCVDLAGLVAWSEYGAPLPWHAGEPAQPAGS